MHAYRPGRSFPSAEEFAAGGAGHTRLGGGDAEVALRATEAGYAAAGEEDDQRAAK